MSNFSVNGEMIKKCTGEKSSREILKNSSRYVYIKQLALCPFTTQGEYSTNVT